MAKNWSDQY